MTTKRTKVHRNLSGGQEIGTLFYKERYWPGEKRDFAWMLFSGAGFFGKIFSGGPIKKTGRAARVGRGVGVEVVTGIDDWPERSITAPLP